MIFYIDLRSAIPATERMKIKTTKIRIGVPKNWNPSEHEALSLRKYIMFDVLIVKTVGLP